MSKKLSADEIDSFTNLLRALRRQLSGDIDDLEQDAFATDGERSSVDDPANSGTDSYSQAFSLELLARDEAILAEIDDALERVRSGTYGRCETCGVWLPRSRLRAMPHARLCVACQRALEKA